MNAAMMRIIKVTSCSASHTSSRKDLGGFGGITFDPNVCARSSQSAVVPLRPKKRRK